MEQALEDGRQPRAADRCHVLGLLMRELGPGHAGGKVGDDRTGSDAQAKEAKKGADKGRPQLLRTMVGAEEIAEVVARATGIPVAKLMQGERDKLLQMEGKLHERVVGQDEAITAVANAIRRSRSGLSYRWSAPRPRPLENESGPWPWDPWNWTPVLHAGYLRCSASRPGG